MFICDNFNVFFFEVMETKPLCAQTVVKTISVGNYPEFLENNPINENIYVVNQISDDVSVISNDTNTMIKTIDIGLQPLSIEYNPNNRQSM